MAYFSPEKAFEEVKKRTASTVKEYFPMEGKKNRLVATDVWVEDDKHIDDIEDQMDARLKGRTWAVPVKARMQLQDVKTGKVKDEKVVTVGQLPKITRRHSYIVNGGEWQLSNQFRLKSGVYNRTLNTGEIAGQWNMEKGIEGRGFTMKFDPSSRKMTVKYGSTNVNLYPVLKSLGVADDDIEKKWGREILDANKGESEEAHIKKLYKAITKKTPDSVEEAKKLISEKFAETKLRPDSTEITLGKPFKVANGAALLTGSDRLLKLSRQEIEEDDRDSLEFKDLWSAEDLIQERLAKDGRTDIRRRINNTLDKKDKVREILGPDTFGRPLNKLFTNSTLSERPDQQNPLAFIIGARKTTIMGQHGIDNDEKINKAAQTINPSHTGFLDPIHTPESKRIGAITQLSLTATKVGKDLKIPVHNLKTGKDEYISARQALRSKLAFPDQYETGKEGYKPRDKKVKIADEAGDVTVADPKDVDYVIKSSKGMFDITANMIPYLQNDQGNRSSMATRQLEQAVPLVNREAPLVQVKGEGAGTFEKAVGALNSHYTPVSGRVTSVKKGRITVKDGDTSHVIKTYDDFPLNDNKSVINAAPTVHVGQQVKKGQLVADSSFTKDGVLSLGTNLRTAYMPWKGVNFEDGVVISESAAKKLTSEHMHRVGLRSTKNTILDKKKFLAETAGKYTRDQADKLDDDGIIKPGMVVNPGDLVIAELKKEELTPEQKSLGLFSRKALKPVKPHAKTWDKEYPGVVSRVVRHGKESTVYIKTATPAEIGDKIVGRHANKGIISDVVPDKDMPVDANGNHMELLLNPAGIPTRINVGQALETAAGKIAEKTGKTFVVNNFDPNVKDYTEDLKAKMKEVGVKDVEDLKNPVTGEVYKDVLAGPQYILKLHHTAEKKLSTRSRGGYTANMTPQAGGDASGQAMDMMGMYALLAHGSRANIREMQTFKSDMNDDLWDRLQTGQPLPPPQVPFVYRKFEGMLRAAGIDVKKDGNTMTLAPLTDKGVESLSNGEIKEPWKILKSKDASPEANGLFDPRVTGTTWPKGKLGEKWGHISLSERIPNPIFERPISALTGVNQKSIADVVAGKVEHNGKTGSAAIIEELKKIDVDKDLARLESQIGEATGSRLNNINKRIKYLRGLKSAGVSPVEAYTMSKVPVLPPNMRPISVNPTGDVNEADLNGLYKGLGAVEYQLRTADPSTPKEEKDELVGSLYDGVKALSLTGTEYKDRYRAGVMAQIAGISGRKKVKEGFFQDKIMGRRQDLSMRGTIVPNPSLNLDEVGLPRKAAAELYKPFVVARLHRMGYSPLQAQKEIRENTVVAKKALEREAMERPVLLKRDPVLHKYGVQAFKPRITESKTVEIHPLVTGGYNADFDGDTMSAFLPIGKDAVAEAFNMTPSHNLFSPSTGDIAYKPGHESLYGLFKLTEMGEKKRITFNNAAEAARAVKDGKIGINDVIRVRDIRDARDMTTEMAKVSAAPVETTVGRLALYGALPEPVRKQEMLTDPNFAVTKGSIKQILVEVGNKSKGEYAQTADALKNIGNNFATGRSISLEDFKAETDYRDRVLEAAQKKELALRANRKLTKAQRDAAIVDLYSKAFSDIEGRAKAKFDKSGNRMYDWIKSGARGDWSQFKQMNLAPGLVVDSQNKVVPVPITKSYSEGLDVGGYWTAMHGARMGTIGRVLGTSEPGALFKKMVTSSMNQMVTGDDCETTKGVAFSSDDENILDRYLAKDVDLGTKAGADKGKIPAGTLVTPRVQTRLKNNKVKEVVVRTPLRCAHGEGVCSKCMGKNEDGGDYEIGTNVGVIAAQALGEPTTQMSMDAFHQGGVSGAAGADAVDKFTRIKQLTELTENLPGAATLAVQGGKVEKIEKDPAGGWGVYVKGTRHFVPARQGLMVDEGAEVKKGDALSGGPKDPRQMMKLTGINSVQRYLTDELSGVYGNPSPLHRRNTEVFVRALTNMSVVKDPGSNKDILPGDTKPRSEIEAYNSRLAKGQAPIVHEPVLKGTNVLPTEMHEDWLARMQATDLKKTLLEGTARGWSTSIHGPHPIPAMAYGKEFGMGTPLEPWFY